MRHILLTVSALVIGSFAWAQEIPPVPNCDLSAGLNEVPKHPPTLVLSPAAPGARSGKVWLCTTNRSLRIFGQVDGSRADWPRNKTYLLSKDHVELWLAGATTVLLPPVGWGNQFGETLAAEEDCDKTDKFDRAPDASKCKEWFRTQLKYRAQFRRLFARQWLLTNDYHIESFATPAYQEIITKYASDQPQHAEEVPRTLNPADRPIRFYAQYVGGSAGYSFTIDVDFSSFPPLSALDIKDVWIMIDVFSAAPSGKKMGPYATTAPNREWGKPSTFNHVRLQGFVGYCLSFCRAPLEEADKYGQRHPAWFIPDAKASTFASQGCPSGVIASDFIVVNDAKGYNYEPETPSPVILDVNHFWKPLGAVGSDEYVCGPELSYRRAGKTLDLSARIQSPEGLDAKKLSDGWALVKSGPQAGWSTFGSGQCGACPYASLLVSAVAPDGKVLRALGIGDVVDVATHSADFTVSPDWQRITYFQGLSDDGEKWEWRATVYCLKGHQYQVCEKQENAHPPDPPNVKNLRGDNTE